MLGVILLTLIALMIVRIIESYLRKRRPGRSLQYRFSLGSVLRLMTALCIVLALGKLSQVGVDRWSWNDLLPLRHTVIPIFLTLLVLKFGSTNVCATFVAGIGGFVVGHYIQQWMYANGLLVYRFRSGGAMTTGEVVLQYLGGPMFIAAFFAMVAEAVFYRIICRELAKRENVIQSSSRT